MATACRFALKADRRACLCLHDALRGWRRQLTRTQRCGVVEHDVDLRESGQHYIAAINLL